MLDEKGGKGIPFVKGSETSFQAAESLQPSLGKLEGMVLAYIELSCGASGATDDQIEEALNLKHQTASARRRELELKGLVVKKYNEKKVRIKRKTRSGRNAGVYVSKKLQDPSLIPVQQQVVVVGEAQRRLQKAMQAVVFRLEMLDQEIAETPELYDSTEIIGAEMQNLKHLFASVLEEGRIRWRELNKE
jgi:hypothetical protein